MPRGIPNARAETLNPSETYVPPEVNAIPWEARDAFNEQIANAQPEPEPVPQWRPATKKFYFRTDHGNRNRLIRIPGVNDAYPQDDFRSDGTTPIREYHLRRYVKRYPDPLVRQMHMDAREANRGEWYIQFQPIPNRFEGYLETDDDALAGFVRYLIASGELPFVYEDSKDVPVQQMPTHRAAAALRLKEAEEKQLATA